MTPRAATPVYGAFVAMFCAALTALGLVDTDGANAATVSAGAALVGSDDVVGPSSHPISTKSWLKLLPASSVRGSHVAARVLTSTGPPKVSIVSRALVAPNAARATRLQRALRAVKDAAAKRADAAALGVKPGALGAVHRVLWREGPVVGQFVVVGAASTDPLVVRLLAIVRARARRTLSQTVWQGLLDRVAARGGRADVKTALQAFSVAVAPLRGVRVPKGRVGSIPSGTIAIRWALRDFPAMSRSQRAAVTAALRKTFGLTHSQPARGRSALAASTVPDAGFDQELDKAIEFFAQRTGVRLTLKTEFMRKYPTKSASLGEAVALDADENFDTGKPVKSCLIKLRPNGVINQNTIAHEVFHCLQYQIVGTSAAFDALGDWLTEGGATFAACSYSQDDKLSRAAYGTYVTTPERSLDDRAYDAVGFFAHAQQSGVDALRAMPAVLTAPTGEAEYAAAVSAREDEILNTWASSVYRVPSRGGDWDVAGPCLPGGAEAAEPTPITLADGDSEKLEAEPLAAHPYELEGSSAEIAHVHSAGGHVRVWGSGVDDQPVTDTYYCIAAAGCSCPAGQHYDGPPLKNLPPGPTPAIALSGGPGGVSATISGEMTRRYCKPGPPPPPAAGVPTCQSTQPQMLCFTFDGTGSAQVTSGNESGSGTETWHMVWQVPLQELRLSSSWPPQAGSTATGHVIYHRDHSIPGAPADCNADMAFDPAQTAEFLADSFSYTGASNAHQLLLVATAPMFRLGATGSCPGYGGPVDAETMVLHPPLGTPNIGAFEQLTFTFSDLPGVYTQSYAAGQHEFTGNGYHGSWTGAMTVQVGP
jgi:hypothetical protein